MNAQYNELAEVAGGFIHEIKNHLSTLSLNLQLLAEDFQEPQTQRERRALTRVQRLEGECKRLVDLSNDFLRFARLKDLQLTPTDLARVIEEMVDFFMPTACAASIDIKPFLPADLPPVLLHRDMFKLALHNLMLNAEQAMPGGGELTIQAACEPGDGTRPDVCLTLIDTGKGMAPEVLARVFEPFFSTKPGGTGLGLPTTRKIVEGHGGCISVESAVERGTKFTLRLRTAAAPLMLVPAAARPEPQEVS
jgi:signal transduction histidine kinase